jgi:hypothetical protein
MKTQIMMALGAASLVISCSQSVPNDKSSAQSEGKIEAQATPSAVAASTVAPVPNPEVAESFKDCSWGEVQGPGLSIYAFTCPPERTSERLVSDPTLPGFALEALDSDGKKISEPAIRILTKSANQPLEAIAEQVRTLSPDAPGGACKFVAWTTEEVDSIGFTGRKLFGWQPTGPAKLAWEDFNSPSDNPSTAPPPPPPCGIAGPQMIGVIVFEEVIGDPTKVAMITIGSGIPVFATETLRSVAR